MPFNFARAIFFLLLSVPLSAGPCSGSPLEATAAVRDVASNVTDIGLFAALGAAMALFAILWRPRLSVPKDSPAARAQERIDNGSGDPRRYQLCFFVMERRAGAGNGSDAVDWWQNERNLSLKELAQKAFAQANRAK